MPSKNVSKSADKLDLLLGLHSLEGVREVDQDGRSALLLRLDGTVSAVLIGHEDQIDVVHMGDQRWARPLITGRLALRAEELMAAAPIRSLICNFIRRATVNNGVHYESVYAIDEANDLIVLEIGYQHRKPERSVLTLTLSSPAPILPGMTARVTYRSHVNFKIERLVVSNSGTADWIVQDIQIGNRSQLSQDGGIPGNFTEIDGLIHFEMCASGMDIAVTVTYSGLNPAGARFSGALIGTIIPHGSLLVVHWTPEGHFASWMAGTEDEVPVHQIDTEA